MSLSYPAARTEEATDRLAGLSWPDPYRWLEGSTDEVRAWQRAQARLASAYVREWAPYGRLQQLVARFNTERYVSVPRYAAGRWFRIRAVPDSPFTQVVMSDQPMGEGQVLFDAQTLNLKRAPFLSWIAPSPDGRMLAIGLCMDGSENNTMSVLEIESGHLLPDVPAHTLMDGWTGGVQWLADSSGFFFTAITGAAIDFEQTVHLHRRLPVPNTATLDIPWTGTQDYRLILVSADGRHAVAVERLQNPIPVAVARLDENPLRWRPFVRSVTGTLAGQPVDGHYIAVTDVGAARGRVVAISLDETHPEDESTWRELVPESEAVIRTVTPVDDLLYLTELVDTYARIRVLNRDGRHIGLVPLPARGAVSEFPFCLMNLIPRGHPRQFLFAFSSLTESAGIYCHTPRSDPIETLREPQARLNNTVVEDRWATSADGTRIPYHIVHRVDIAIDRPQPTLIYGYGGFNVALVPRFPGPMAAFVAAGGVFVHAHLRGGGELGLSFWQSGRMQSKQNSYNDLYAIAEDLIASGCSTAQSLAVTGGSNGGLMAAVALTQRPDLWAVAVPRIPILDLVGACREVYGRQAVLEELAEVEEPAEAKRLTTFSPYHLVRTGKAYPAVFLDAGDTDPRCPAWHARKFAARLQAASSAEAPILLHVWENVGHGWATDRQTAVSEHTEWLAFTLRRLGVTDLDVGDETDCANCSV